MNKSGGLICQDQMDSLFRPNLLEFYRPLA
jgi:hypothetical protein